MILCPKSTKTYMCHFKLKMGVDSRNTWKCHRTQGQECSQASELEYPPDFMVFPLHPFSVSIWFSFSPADTSSLCTLTLAEDAASQDPRFIFIPTTQETIHNGSEVFQSQLPVCRCASQKSPACNWWTANITSLDKSTIYGSDKQASGRARLGLGLLDRQ